jgi:predicted nucleic acid-binding protein
LSAADSAVQVAVLAPSRGLPLDENDLRIAATALALGATLVSRDSDFQTIEGLALIEP